MSVEATITINDKIPPIKLMSENKEKFLNELIEQVKITLSNVEENAEITAVMRMVTTVSKVS